MPLCFLRCLAVLALGVHAAAHGHENTRLIQGPAPDGVVPTLINGTPVAPGAWKQTVRIQVGSSFCTASVVGPRVLATAAHCTPNNGTATFRIDGVSYSARMTRHPDYPRRDIDLALGVITTEVRGIEYGILPDTVDVAKVNMPIRLMGYGCINPGSGTGGNDGILREGMSTITRFSGNDIVTGQTNGAALCFGDSGGPAWLEVRRGDRLVRYNISQNSKGDIARTSYLARWDSTTAQSFARSFIQNNGNIEICGINRQCGGPPPEPDPEPEPGPDPGPAPDPQGRKFTLDGRTVFVAVTVKDATLALDYVRQMFQNLVSFLDD
jgi:hypothetical protein